MSATLRPLAEPLPATSVTTSVLPLADCAAPASAAYDSWRTLFEHDPAALIVQHPDCVLLEADNPRRPGFLVIAQQGATPVACAILVAKSIATRRAGGLGPGWTLSGYRLVGNRLLGAAASEVAQALIHAVADEITRRGADFLLVEDLLQPSAERDAWQSLAARGFRFDSPTGLQERLRIRWPEVPADYWKKFSSKTRSTFRRKEKKFGGARLERITRVEQVADFLEQSRAISEYTWQSAQLGLRIKNDAAELRYFTFLAQQGALRSYLLHDEQGARAFLIGIQHRGLFLYEEVGFDRRFAHLSPGQVLLVKVLEDLTAEQPPAWFDFGGGDAEYKRIFANDAAQSGTLWIIPPGWRRTSLLRYLHASRYIRHIGRRLLHATGGFARLRRTLRDQAAARPAADDE